MVSQNEEFKYTADVTGWRLGLIDIQQHLSQVRRGLTSVTKSSDVMTEKGKKNAQELVASETRLLQIRKQLQEQLRRAGGMGYEAGMARGKDGMRSFQMQAMSLGFALDDLFTVMAHQKGLNGFVMGLAAASNNISMILAAYNPFLAFLPSIGVLMLKSVMLPTLDANKALEKQGEILKGLQDGYEKLKDKKLGMQLGDDLAAVQVEFREFRRELAKDLAEVGKQEQAAVAQRDRLQLKGNHLGKRAQVVAQHFADWNIVGGIKSLPDLIPRNWADAQITGGAVMDALNNPWALIDRGRPGGVRHAGVMADQINKGLEGDVNKAFWLRGILQNKLNQKRENLGLRMQQIREQLAGNPLQNQQENLQARMRRKRAELHQLEAEMDAGRAPRGVVRRQIRDVRGDIKGMQADLDQVQIQIEDQKAADQRQEMIDQLNEMKEALRNLNAGPRAFIPPVGRE